MKQKKFDDLFENEVPMYMYEEMIDGRKLTEIVNTKHENVKYLPGFKLPENVVCLSLIFICTKNIQNRFYMKIHSSVVLVRFVVIKE